MWYRRILFILSLLCVTTALTSCSSEKPLTSIESSSVAKVEISDDEGGKKLTIEDTTQINDIIRRINDLNLKNGHKNNKKGYAYWINLYDSQNTRIAYIGLLSDESVSMNGYLYAKDCKEFINYISSIYKQ